MQRRTKGFTLIELMLAMTFISVLLITIAMTIIQMGTIYNRGMALKEVNQSARDIADDLRRTLTSSEIFTVNKDADTTDLVRIKDTIDGKDIVVGGRLCLGMYSYIWNTAKATELNSSKLAKYVSGTGEAVRFIKLPDAGKQYCAKGEAGGLVKQYVPSEEVKLATRLISSGDRNLGVQNVSITTTDSAVDEIVSQRVYTFSYTLGTGLTSAMTSDQSACLPPEDENANLTYCNVQAFTIALTAGDGVN